ncbi:MAG: acetyltransferase [Gammaproteobacteria bacterium]|nr:acetyltransferase [Gammaproteobacteria bacterium]
MKTSASQEKHQELARAVRDACIEAALEGYESARISGLCHEGAWEAAVSAMRVLDLERVLKSERE